MYLHHTLFQNSKIMLLTLQTLTSLNLKHSHFSILTVPPLWSQTIFLYLIFGHHKKYLLCFRVLFCLVSETGNIYKTEKPNSKMIRTSKFRDIKGDRATHLVPLIKAWSWASTPSSIRKTSNFEHRNYLVPQEGDHSILYKRKTKLWCKARKSSKY